jgi:hypothetical protein
MATPWPIAFEAFRLGWSLLTDPTAGPFLYAAAVAALSLAARAALPPVDPDAEEAILIAGLGAM